MEYNEKDVSDDEQIVVEDEHEQWEDEEDDEPEEEEDEEKNPWVDIREEVKEPHKKKLEALITKFQKIGNSQELAGVKAYNSLVPLYREELKDVLLENLKWICALKKDPIYWEVVATRDELMAERDTTG